MTLKKMEDGIYAKESTINEIQNIDGIIFDCDGVLVDVSNSYDLAIQKTTAYILKEIANISKFDPVTFKIIDAFKATGGFNDEVDLTYAAILSLAAANNLKKSGIKFLFEVIKNADQLNLVGLAKQVSSMADNARHGRLKPDDTYGGTFTLSNVGSFGSLMGTPIINQPQVAILCVGAIEKRPKVMAGADGEDTIAIRTCAYFSLSFDHRIVDGADADRFMGHVKAGLQEFDEAGL